MRQRSGMNRVSDLGMETIDGMLNVHRPRRPVRPAQTTYHSVLTGPRIYYIAFLS